MKLLILSGFFCLSAHAANINTNCSTQAVPQGASSPGMVCHSHTTEANCVGLAEVVTEACQGYAKITFNNGTFAASCGSDSTGSFVQFACSNN